ncbi:MAG TPA: polysaccharide export protein [Gammaproteobacteria bacterium]|nr:polysaccharide export protein [Gammaproteobacteria bacterium]
MVRYRVQKKLIRLIIILQCVLIGAASTLVSAGEKLDDAWLNTATSDASSTGQRGALKKNQVLANNIVLSTDPLPEVKGGGDYNIGAHDLLTVKVFQAAELSGDVRVDFLGAIHLPLIGAVKVRGLTPTQVSWLVAKKYGEKYLQNPQVTVFVKEYTSQRVIVSGFVVKPGVYPLEGYTTLLEAIAKAEGLKRLADMEKIVIFRSNEQHKVTGYLVDLKKVQEGLAADPTIIAGDRIVVPQSGGRSFIENVTNILRGFVGFGTL